MLVSTFTEVGGAAKNSLKHTQSQDLHNQTETDYHSIHKAYLFYSLTTNSQLAPFEFVNAHSAKLLLSGTPDINRAQLLQRCHKHSLPHV